MPRTVIDIDKINNMSAKMGRLTIPVIRTKKPIRTVKKVGLPLMTRAVKKTKKVMKKVKGKKK